MAGVLAALLLLIGSVLAFVPGLPGALVAYAGLVVYAAMVPGVPDGALAVGAAVAILGTVAQLAAPVVAARAVTSSVGAASGALAASIVASVVAAPLAIAAPWLVVAAGSAGAVLGALVRGPGVLPRVGALATGCVALAVAIGVDLLAVLAVGAVLGAVSA